MTPMSTRIQSPAAPATTPRTGRTLRLRGPWRHGRGLLRGASLARRFLVANLVILLVAGLVVGLWVGDRLERSIVERTASVTALYVSSIIEPSVASLAEGSDLTAAEIAALDADLASSPLADRVRSLRIWSPDGQIVYSPDASLIGRSFPVEGNLARAWEGEVVAHMDDLSGEENAWERARWSRLLEIYIPVRERGSDRIIAVAEFYLPPRDIDRQVGEARLASWAVVSLAIVASAVLLFGIVKQGSDTIKRQEAALTRQVDELTGLLERNATLSERVRTAAERTTTLNERSLRRLSSDLHDGPGQMLSLALLRLDAIRTRATGGRLPGPAELAELEQVLRESMGDMRAIAAGLRVPELASMAPRDIAARAVSDHERRSGSSVVRDLADDVPERAPLPVKIALFRSLQEALSNATRHGRGLTVHVRLRGDAAAGPGGPAAGPGGPAGALDRLVLDVSDDGAGFDPADLPASEGLGLAGIREQAELLGGGFEAESSPGSGTRLRVWWPLGATGSQA
jgi:signal transduction histidine kinase